MPELPELQAHAERLGTAFRGATLGRFDALSFTALKTVTPPPDAAAGRALDDIGRRGKHLLLRFGDITFVVHLMQGGRLSRDDRQIRRPRGGVARWHFDDGRALLLTEAGTERRAGVWVVTGDPLAQEPLVGLGQDVDTLTQEDLARLLAANSMRLHTFLRDQRLAAGIGRRLANEVCHRARISPFAPTTSLDDADAQRLVGAMRDAIGDELAAERAREDMSRAADRVTAVHGRTGEPCPVCGDTVRSVEYRDYSVHYCPGCQTGGRVLADNVTSKFLK
jgi:formamidopyrimidine-DNA glycosylase